MWLRTCRNYGWLLGKRFICYNATTSRHTGNITVRELLSCKGSNLPSSPVLCTCENKHKAPTSHLRTASTASQRLQERCAFECRGKTSHKCMASGPEPNASHSFEWKAATQDTATSSKQDETGDNLAPMLETSPCWKTRYLRYASTPATILTDEQAVCRMLRNYADGDQEAILSDEWWLRKDLLIDNTLRAYTNMTACLPLSLQASSYEWNHTVVHSPGIRRRFVAPHIHKWISISLHCTSPSRNLAAICSRNPTGSPIISPTLAIVQRRPLVRWVGCQGIKSKAPTCSPSELALLFRSSRFAVS